VAKAKLLRSTDVFLPEGWRVVIISPSGDRVVGYDNHHPKGDHRHFRGVEETYTYKDPETLIGDFLKDVELVLSGKEDS